MHTRIRKWGNSQGLRISKDLLANANLNVGDEVDVEVKNGVLIIAPTKKIRGRYKLEDLVAGIPKNHQEEEVDSGKPSGQEEW